MFSSFTNTVWSYYLNHGRSFPWRETDDPYAILLSEFMLQQTQTDRVIPKFELFLNHLPTILSLAEADQSAVLKLWQGLGYNRRALYLHQTAKNISENFGGHVLEDVVLLQSLPGIGPYTAKAVATFAFNQPHVLIETNIRTVYIYHFFDQTDEISDKEIFPLIEETLDTKRPREWYYALMDYGVMLKKTVGNQNVKSKHYTKQNKFDGSNRQLRGHILTSLINDGRLSFTSLLTTHNGSFSQTDIQKALEQLEYEGFITRDTGQQYRLKG